MYTRDTPDCAIDSVYCAEMQMKRVIPGAPLGLRLVMVYMNRSTNDTFGTCPLAYDESVDSTTLSKDTLKKLEEFIESAERDLGKLIFERGHTEGQSGAGAEAESGLPLQMPKGIGG